MRLSFFKYFQNTRCPTCTVFYLYIYYFPTEIENDGVIEPDTDAPQEMGDFENLEVK